MSFSKFKNRLLKYDTYQCNYILFGLLFFLFSALISYSFICAWALDEGTIGNDFYRNFFAEAFIVFRFPAHTILWPLFETFELLGAVLYFPGLIFNILFYSVLAERLSAIIRF